MPISINCNKCGKVFKVKYIADWKYSYTCDKCILKSQPWGQEYPQDERDNKRYEFNESTRQLMEQELWK